MTEAAPATAAAGGALRPARGATASRGGRRLRAWALDLLLLRPVPAGLPAALLAALFVATEGAAQARSSGGYARPRFSGGYGQTPSTGRSRVAPRTPSTSGGYHRPGADNRAQRYMGRAEQQRDVAARRAEAARQAAGLSGATSGLSVAIKAMQDNAARNLAEAEATNAKARLLQPTRPERDDPNIAAAMQAASGALPVPTGLSERLAALRGRQPAVPRQIGGPGRRLIRHGRPSWHRTASP